MTTAAKSPSKTYIEDGTTLNFAVPFRYLAASDLVVDRIATSGAVTRLALGIGYSATVGTTDAGGTLTLLSTVAGAKLRIRRATARNQSTDYATNDTFPAESHEAALDRAMLIDQEQDVQITDLQTRALLVPDGETAGSLPPSAGNGNKFLGRDAGLNWTYFSGTGADAALRTDLAKSTGLGLVGYNGKSAQAILDAAAGTGPILIAITGQSNAAGSMTGGPNPASSRVKVWDGVTGDWGSSDYTQNPLARSSPDGNSGCNNLALSMAHGLYDETGRDVYIVFDAVGGTSIAKWFKQDTFTGDGATTSFALTVPLDATVGNNNVTITSVTINGVETFAYTTKRGTYNYTSGTITFSVAPANNAAIVVNYSAPRYANLAAKITAALASPAMVAAGKTTIDALIWSQGEEDYTRSYSWYKTAFKAITAQFRSETWMRGIGTATENFTPSYVVGPNHLSERNMICDALSDVCNSQFDGKWIYVPVSGTRTTFEVTGAGDNSHYSGWSLWYLGYEVMRKMFLRGPRLGNRFPANLFYARAAGAADPSNNVAIGAMSSLVSWQSRTGGGALVQTFTGDGATTAFTLDYQGWSLVDVYVGGVSQSSPANYSVSGQTLTFTTAPSNGAEIVVGYSTYILGPNNNGSIIWGYACYTTSSYALCGGYKTTIGTSSLYNAAWGREITIGNSSSYNGVFGFQSRVTGGYNLSGGRLHTVTADNTFTAGVGHTLADDSTAAIGTYSKYTTTQTDRVRFQVGSGANAGARANAFAVRNSGVMEHLAIPVASLPPASNGVQRAFVNNSSVAASGNFGAVVAAGGANVVPVYSDGTSWRIG